MSKESTYSGQSTLPRLPIPRLEETLDRFARVLYSIQNPDERKATLGIISEFLHGDGPKLQSLLEAYDKEGKETGNVHSYVEEFWSDAYLKPNYSVVLNLNPYFLLEVKMIFVLVFEFNRIILY